MYLARAEPPVAASSATKLRPLVMVTTLPIAAVVTAPYTKIFAPESNISNTRNVELLTEELETVMVVPFTILATFALSTGLSTLMEPVVVDTLVKNTLLVLAISTISNVRFSVA